MKTLPAFISALLCLTALSGGQAPGATPAGSPAKKTVSDSTANAKEEKKARKDMDILLGIKGKKKEETTAKTDENKNAGKVEYDKNEPESPPFVVNTIDGKRRKIAAKGNGETFQTVFETYYATPGNGRVTAAIYRLDTLQKKDSLTRTLLVQNKSRGQHYLYWDGTDEHGLKLIGGRFECRVQFAHNADDSAGRDTLMTFPIQVEK